MSGLHGRPDHTKRRGDLDGPRCVEEVKHEHVNRKARAWRKKVTVSHRERLAGELSVDPELAAKYFNSAADDSDLRVYLTAPRTVTEAQGIDSVQSPLRLEMIRIKR